MNEAITMHPTNALKSQATLGSYALAASALGLAAAPASAEMIPADPMGGFPILVDSVNTVVDFDLNGDTFDDVRISYNTDYGGGFDMIPLDRADTVNEVVGYRINPSFAAGQPISRQYVEVAPRFDVNEWVDQGTEYINYACYCGMMLDTPFRAGYHPFVDRPGFVAMRLEPAGSNLKQLGYLEIIVSDDSQSLMVLSGGFDAGGNFALQMPSSVTPPPVP